MTDIQSKETKSSIFKNKTVHDYDFSLKQEEFTILKNKYEAFRQRFTLLRPWQETTFKSNLESPLLAYLFQSQIENAKRIIEPSFLAILCDTNGVIASYACSQDNEIFNSMTGSSLALKYAGINAVSASMEFNKPVYMRYKDHTLAIFEDWACFAVPIVDSSNKLVGYFDLSTYCSVKIKHYFPLCLHISKVIGSYVPLKDFLQQKVKQLPLSDRKKEVCWLWILDYDYKQIAQQLHISPNTVRVLVSQIYEALNASSKSSIILKIMEGYPQTPQLSYE